MEPVPETSITGLKITPDVDNSLVSVQVSLSGNTQVSKKNLYFQKSSGKINKIKICFVNCICHFTNLQKNNNYAKTRSTYLNLGLG